MKIKKLKETDIEISVNNRQISDYPVFCFKYFIKNCLTKCNETQIKEFLQRLQCLGEIGWKEICKSGRHNYGFEMLPIEQIKSSLPACITPDIKKVMVFRYNNNNNPFIAIRVENVLRILVIEGNFGDVYNHG